MLKVKTYRESWQRKAIPGARPLRQRWHNVPYKYIDYVYTEPRIFMPIDIQTILHVALN